jgi:hypothetical protein
MGRRLVARDLVPRSRPGASIVVRSSRYRCSRARSDPKAKRLLDVSGSHPLRHPPAHRTTVTRRVVAKPSPVARTT